MAPASAQPGCGRAITRRPVPGMQGVWDSPLAALELVFTCWGGHAEAAKAISPAAVLHLAGCLSCCVCLSAGLMGRVLTPRSGAVPGSQGCPNPRQQPVGRQPFSLPRPARPGTGRGAWQPPCATCVPGRQRTPQLGNERRDVGRCRGRRASCNCGASHGCCPRGPHVVPLCPAGPDEIARAGCSTSLWVRRRLLAATGELLGARG